MLQYLVRSFIPLLTMESTQVELPVAYQRADTYIDQLLSSEDAQTRAIAKEQLKGLLYQDRDSSGISCAKLDRFLTQSNTKEVARVLARKARARIVFGAECTFNPLPDRVGDLSEEEMKLLYFFNVPEQTNGWTCGYWGVYNAKAVLELYESGACITNSSITERARALYAQLASHIADIGKEYELENDKPKLGEMPRIDVLIKLAQYLDKQSPGKLQLAPLLHFITYLQTGELPTFSEEDPSVLQALGVNSMEEISLTPRTSEQAKGEIAKKFCDDFRRSGITFFMCYLYDPSVHWILLPIIRLNTSKHGPVTPVLDSYNFDIFPEGDAVKVIEFVNGAILRPLREKKESE